MTERLEALVTQLELVFYGNPWYGEGVIEKLDKLEPSIVSKESVSENHTIPQLIMHMTSWKQYVLEKMSGNDTYRIVNDSEIEWPLGDEIISIELAIINLKKTHDELVDALKKKDDDWLDAIVAPTSFNYATLIQGIIHHDIYHLGQIGIIFKALSQGTQAK